MAELKRRGRPEESEVSERDDSEKQIARAADSIIVWTEDERQTVAEYCNTDPEKISVIPPGVDLSHFRPMSKQEARSHLGYGEEKNILFVGRLEPLKGVDRLINAVASLENAATINLTVVGGDDNSTEKARLQAVASRMKLNSQVNFVGAIDQSELPIYYNAADVCVMPSYYESFGLAALEAAACGTPVVASEVGGLPAIVQDGETGYLVPVKRADVMAEKLCHLLSDDLARHRMGTAARNHAETLSWDQSAEKLYSRFRELTPLTGVSAGTAAGG